MCRGSVCGDASIAAILAGGIHFVVNMTTKNAKTGFVGLNTKKRTE